MERIYVVIEFNGLDAIARGAFTNEQEAWNALDEWKGSSTANWTVRSCTLNK